MLKHTLLAKVLLLITTAPYSQTPLNQQLIFQDRDGGNVVKNLFVGNLGSGVTHEELRRLFEAYGHFGVYRALANSITSATLPSGAAEAKSFPRYSQQGASNTVTLTCDKPTGTGTDSKVVIQVRETLTEVQHPSAFGFGVSG